MGNHPHTHLNWNWNTLVLLGPEALLRWAEAHFLSQHGEGRGGRECVCPHLLKERCHGAGEGSQGRKHIVHHIQLCFLQNQGWAANVGV